MPRRKQLARHPHKAYWCLPSFQRVSDGTEPTKIFFIGHHVPSRSKTRTNKLPPAPDFAIISEYEMECIPFESKDIPTMLASIEICSPLETFQKQTNSLLRMLLARSHKRIYREFDINQIDIGYALALANNYGENWDVEVPLKEADFVWLKGGYAFKTRKGIDHNATVDQIILIGKDVRYNKPVVALCKDWMDYRSFMHFWDDGIRTSASIKFLVHKRPEERYKLLDVDELERKHVEKMTQLKDSEFVKVDFSQAVQGIKEQVEI